MTILFFALSGLISGIVSRVATIYTGDLWITAGVVFGVALALCNRFLYRTPTWKSIAWIVASTVSYYVAVYVAIAMIGDNTPKSVNAEQLAFFVGGVVGAALMLLSFHFLLHKIRGLDFVLLMLVGGLLGLTWFFGKDATLTSFVFDQPFWLYLFWQTGMALGLGVAISRQE